MDESYELDSSELKPHVICKVIGTNAGSVPIRLVIIPDGKGPTQSFHQLVSQTKRKIKLKFNIKCIFVEIQKLTLKTRATSIDVSSVFTIAVIKTYKHFKNCTPSKLKIARITILYCQLTTTEYIYTDMYH